MKMHNIKLVRMEVDGASFSLSIDHDLAFTAQDIFDDLFRPALLAQGFSEAFVDRIVTGEVH